MTRTIRRQTRTVFVGKTGIGSFHPIRIQSMLTSESTDPEGVMREIRALNDCGCELVRITIPNGKALDTAKEIRRRMESEGIVLPLIADIHFNPRLAVDACELFEKVRINPGNYADRKKFKVRKYSDSQYNDELERVEESLLPLIKSLKFHQRALRVGTNHGSLSDRVMNRYGDTPEGMVQSAMEYLRILEKHQFHDTILSMKSSNPLVMKEAYRLLVQRMESEQMDYPLHLGVTEAGNGLDGRIKSAVGIGGLLNEGLGDTIRVSLTEPSQNEIPVARAILRGLERFEDGSHHTGFPVPKIIPAYTLSPVVEIEGCRIGPKETFKLLAL
ncbi:MAG: (E)-4-hydroxy-3-methylbut-2-enyl-diphosphate synthase, partial [SAR324 cluster bacterium]|nr:(E)-4-hydroxy-3-methylbut-2-enyl-diphosphate synthase [SAR324 cluster bacterium]